MTDDLHASIEPDRPVRKPTGPHPHHRLTGVAVRKLGPGRHADGNGLYLEVDPSGVGRRWFLRTVVYGDRKDIGLGPVTLVSLAEAREMARRLRRVARAGGDPIAERDKDKKRSPSFEDAARHVFTTRILPATKKPEAMQQWLGRLERHAFPVIGKRPIHTITQADLLRVLEPIWLTKSETARRVRQRMAVIFDWARTAGHISGVNPVDGIEAGLPRQRDRVKHHAALPWKQLPELWPRLEDAGGMGTLALRFAILAAVRTMDVRFASWDDIDLDAATWIIPEDKAKMGEQDEHDREHRVPLSEPALAILRLVQPLAARPTDLVFPGRRRGKPISENAMSDVLERLDVPVTVHGFRSSFRDWAEETTSFSHEVKEAALAHVVKNKTEAAYRRTDLFDRRRDMMDAWARFVLGGGAEVVRIADAG
jgi:integrase